MKNGFSLTELVIALALAGLLLLVAIPSYRQYVQRAYRAEAIRLILAAADCLERTRVRNGLYDTASCGEAGGNARYRLHIDPPGQPGATGYVVAARPILSAAGDACGSLTLDQAGTRRITGSPDLVESCWGGR